MPTAAEPGFMRVSVDRALCHGCGDCERAVPEVFRLDAACKAVVVADDIPPELCPLVVRLVALCPDQAIHVRLD